MLVGSACFDPHTIEEAAAGGGGGHHVLVEDGFSQTHVPNNCSPNFSSMESSSHSYHHHHHHHQKVEDAMEMGIQQQLINMEMEHCYDAINNKVANNNNNINIRDQHMMQEAAGAGVGHDLNRVLSCDQSNWEDINLSYQDHSQQQQQQMHHPPGVHEIDIHNLQRHGPPNNFGTVSLPVPDVSEAPFPHTPDLLHMLPLPRCSPSSLFPNSSISFGNTSTSTPKSSNLLSSLGLLGDINGGHDVGTPASSVVFDPILPLNLPQHEPPFLRELIHSLPHGYSLGMGGSRSGGSLFSGVDDGETSGGFFQDGGDGRTGYDNGVFEFTADMNCMGKGRVSKNTKHFTTEKQRRVHMNGKFNVLRSLVPNPTKNDRASIVGDAIEYINELKRTVGELKILVEKKRCSRERVKRAKEENGNDQVNNIKNHDHVMLEDIDDHHHHHHHHPYNGSTLRSSWLHRKSKSSEVDVRIVDDEVTVKLVQQKRINCLLFVSKVLDELQLDLHHVAGGLIGDSYSFLFNSKICEGSTVYAHAIANKLIDVVDKQYAAASASASQPTGSY